MRHNRVKQTTLSLALISSLVGSKKKPSKVDENIQDGTYTAVADGYGGQVKVETIISSGAISSVKILAEAESMTISDSALSDVPARIVDKQSVNVDGSTGATVTSDAVKNAVLDCLSQAGADLSFWQKDTTEEKIDSTKTLTTDAVVIGGGIAGIAATLRLQQLGVSVVLLEKGEEIGASLQYIDGTQIVTGSSLSADGSIEILEKDLNAIGNNEADEVLQNILLEGIGETIDWEISDLGVKFSDTLAADEDYSRLSLSTMTDDPESLQLLLEKELNVSGANVITETMAYELLQEDGQITGVKAKASDGTVYEVFAENIIIASGGYGNSTSLLPDSLYYGPEGNTGDILVMGNDLTLATSSVTEKETLWPAVKVKEHYAIDAADAMEEAVNHGAIIVNGEGRRFADETDMDELLNAVADGVDAYLVMDGSTYDTFKEMVLEGADKELIEKLSDPETGMDAVLQAETLEEAAELSGLDAAEVRETVDQYAEYCSSLVDEAYGRDIETLLAPVESEGYAIVPLHEAVWMTLGGLSADENLHVLKQDGSAIENLYVIGGAVGNVFGTDMPAGGGTTWAFVSAKHVADGIGGTAKALESSAPEQ